MPTREDSTSRRVRGKSEQTNQALIGAVIGSLFSGKGAEAGLIESYVGNTTDHGLRDVSIS